MTMAPNLRSFSFNLTDLQFILDQINFRPLFYKNASGSLSAVINWDGTGAVYDSLGNLISNGGAIDPASGLPNQAALDAVAAWGTSYNSYVDISGLRDVTGNYNNLIPGQQYWGAVNQDFTRIAAADFNHYVQQAIAGSPTATDSKSSLTSDGPVTTYTVQVPVPFGTPYSISFNAFTRTITVTDIASTDNHHMLVNHNTITTTTTTQNYTQDVTGEHTYGSAVIGAPVITSTISGGELDPMYHQANPMNGTLGLDVLISNATVGTLAMNNYNPGKSVVDYTPRMISETITSGGHVTYDATGHYVKGDGVVLLHDTTNHIVYWNAARYAAGGLAGASVSDLAYYNTIHGRAIDTSGLVEGSAIVDTSVPLMPGQPDGSGDPSLGTGDGNVYAGNGYGELALVGQHDKQNIDANNATGHGNHEYFYGNIASIGGNAPNNGFMALFGQFFDHGLDFIAKNGQNANGSGQTVTITIPLAVDDPLYGQLGPDGQPQHSITINRATVNNQWVHDAAGNVLDGHDLAHSVLNAAGTAAAVDALGHAVSTAGADGIWGTADDIATIGADRKITGATFAATSPTYINHDSPYIDQSQTYGSVDDVTQLLRQWVQDPNTGKWMAGAGLYDGHQTVAYTNPFAGTAGQPDMIQNTLPTLNELRAEVTRTGRTALTWEDVSGDYRHRDTNGHVGLFSNTPNPATDPVDKLPPEIAYIDAAGVTRLVSDDSPLTGSALATVLANTHTIGSTEPLLLDMNPRFDLAHMNPDDGNATTTWDSDVTAKVNAAIGTMNAAGSVTGTITAANIGLGTLIANGWIDPSTFSITATDPALHAAVGEVLMAAVGDHYIAGDGRANENFGLTAIHHVFHEEHNFQVQNIEDAIHSQDKIATDLYLNNNHGAGIVGDVNNNHQILHGWQEAVLVKAGDMVASGINVVSGHYEDAVGDYTDAAGNVTWDQSKVFDGAKLTVEMEYQHSVVDQYARAVSPNIQEFAGVTSSKNGAIALEYGQAAFRFGHSTLRDTIDTMDPTQGITGKIMSYALENAFLNPGQYAQVGAGAVIMGEARQLMNEVDQFVTPSLNEGLLGQPLDLAAINIARGRDVGIPTLNAFKAASGVGTVYNSWNDFRDNMIHPERIIDFVAAYSFDGNLDKAQTIVDLNGGVALSATEQAIATDNGWNYSFAHRFMTGDKTADTADGVNHIDLWIGGLAEVHVAGGILGETFDAIFVNQIENLMDGDRLYYLQRLVNQGFGNEMQNEQMVDIFERTTGTSNLNGNIFTYADAYYDEGKNARIATQSVDVKHPELLTDLYDDAARVHKVFDGATGKWLVGTTFTGTTPPAGIGTTVHLTDVWGNEVVDLYKDANHLVKAFDAATMTWLDATYAQGAKSLYFADGTYIGAPQHKYGSLVTDHQTDIAVASAMDVTDPNNGHSVADTGLGTVVGTTQGLGIWSGDDATTIANGTITDHTITVKYGDESTAGSSQTIQFHESFINDARPTGSTVNLDGSIDNGTNSAEVMVGTANDDYMRMGIGDDTAYGGAGNDFLFGGMANAGANKLYGGDGNDYLVGGDAPDLIDGGAGDDWIFEQSSGSSVNGVGQSIGGSGNDHIFGGIGIDKIFGGTGDDYIYGGSDTDPVVFGGDGNDYMNGNSGVDVMNGDNGDDIMDGGAGVDQLFGGNGDDILRPGDIADVAGNGGGGDVLIGGDAATNNAGVSTDTGFDFADYSQTTTSVGLVGDLANQAAVGTLPADKTPLPPGVPRATNIGDVWFEMEGIIGTKNNDHLMGDSTGDAGAIVSLGDNWLIGGSGNDLLQGRGGNDVIVGGSVRLDTLIGAYARPGGGSAYHAANDYSVNAEGASHRIYDDAMLGAGFLDGAGVGGAAAGFAKHLTTLEESLAYKDYVLGDTAGLANVGNDTAVYTGNKSQYTVIALDIHGNVVNNPHVDGFFAIKITDNRTAADLLDVNGNPLLDSNGNPLTTDGTDVVIGVNNIQFADQTMLTAAFFDKAPVVDLHYVAGTTTLASDSFTPPPNGNAYGRGTGWLGNWQETGDNNNSGSGQIRVDTVGAGGTNNGLHFVGGTPAATYDGASISRGVNLSAVSSATLNFSARETGISGTETVKVYFQVAAPIATDVPVYTISSATDTGATATNHSISLTGPFDPAAKLYFVGAAMNATTDNVYIDNITITATADTFPGNDNAVTYAEGNNATGLGTAVAITTFPHITDPDVTDLTIASAKITVREHVAGDELHVGALPAGISATGNGTGTGGLIGATQITLLGVATQALYQTALAAITFDNTTQDPTNHGANLNRHIDVTVNDGLLDSAVATTTVNINAINNPTVAHNDTIITNVGTGVSFVVADQALLANDVDPDTTLAVSGVSGATGLTVAHSNTTHLVTLTDTPPANGTFNYGVNGQTASVKVTQVIGNILTADNSGQILVGGSGNDTMTGGTGNDTMIWNVSGTVTRNNNGTFTTNVTTGGHDFVDGGVGTDTFILNSTVAGTGSGNNLALANATAAVSETFNVYSNTDGTGTGGHTGSSAALAGLTGLNTNAEIVITRNGAIAAELAHIEEIQINTGAGADTVNAIGNFNGTSLAFSTITINDADGGDKVNISGLTSDHRIVFNTDSTGQVIGTLRPQDVVNNGSIAGADTSGTGTTDTGSTGSTDTSGSGSTDTAGSGSTDASGSSASGSDGGTTGSTSDTGSTGGTGTTDPILPAAPVDHAVTINGADGASVQTAGDQNNTIIGHTGDDLISVGNGNNMLDGGAGNDTIVAGNGNNMIFGGDGNDHIFVGNGNNTIDAGNGDDAVFSGTGTNVFVAHANDGADSYYGGGGNDTLDMSAIMTNVEANLGSGGGSGYAKTGGVIDTIHNVQNIITGIGDDTITASDAHNIIDVGDHSATGHDTVIFRTAASADGDNIVNFQTGDKIDLHGMMNGTINLVPSGPAAANHDIAVQFDATTHGDSIVTGIDEGGNHFSFDVKGHHLIGTDFAA